MPRQENHTNVGAIGACVLAAAFIVAAPYGCRKFNERDWPEAVKRTDYRHAFVARANIGGAVNEAWRTYTPDDVTKGDCTGTYLFIERTSENFGEKFQFRMFAGVIKDGQPDNTEKGQDPANNLAYIAQVTGFTPEARAIYEHAYRTHFNNPDFKYDDVHTLIIPMEYGAQPQAVSSGNRLTYTLPQLGNMALSFDRQVPGRVVDMSVGGVYSGSYTLHSGHAAPVPAPVTTPVPAQR